ncbi:hypothetical protein [Sulfoacidibacillus ferrooxidans]|uniref:Uncharacterized protein n=1 Tax=Sulfoacidibacillus ferrooxidans TaxID=2005001 RepID=A0A9X2ADF7_9BACL|nr:hypothetical protein [Sulfoacidibacillus ferrooxidans]MCI0184854.1 hypothetical protein [Sulfoacidibacillus ferrooxidans]
MKPLLNQQELYQVTCTLVRETPIGTHVWRVSEWMPMVTPSGYIDQVAEFHLQLNGRVYISTFSHSHVQRVRHHHERFPLDATSAPVQMRKNLHLQTGRKKRHPVSKGCADHGC